MSLYIVLLTFVYLITGVMDELAVACGVPSWRELITLFYYLFIAFLFSYLLCLTGVMDQLAVACGVPSWHELADQHAEPLFTRLCGSAPT